MPNSAHFQIIPQPAKLLKREGRFNWHSGLRIAAASLSGNPESSAAKLLAGWLSARRADGDCKIVSGEADIRFEVGEGMKEEAYRLDITPSQITITGSETGWVRGAAALVVMLEEEGWAACQIEDEPRFAWRGMHLDVCRHFYPIQKVKRLIDLIALHRMNTFHWHLTDDQGWRIAIDAFPQLSEISAWRDRDGEPYGGCYTKDEVRDVLAYAEERKIQVVPEIEMPGHALAALAAFPELSCAGGTFQVANTCGIFDDVYCAGKEKTFEFLEKVLEEVSQLFPGKYVHVGGDECPKTRWKECPDCQKRMQDEGLKTVDELQSWFITRAGRALQSMGKHLIGWDEILDGGLAPGALVMSWRGTEGGIAAARMGHEAIMTPTSHCYFDYRNSDEPEEPGNLGRISLETVYGYNPTPADLDASAKSKILGVQANIWTERMPTWRLVEYMILPRLCALAEVAWSPAEVKDWESFQSRLEGHMKFLKEMDYTYRHPLRAKREFPL